MNNKAKFRTQSRKLKVHSKLVNCQQISLDFPQMLFTTAFSFFLSFVVSFVFLFSSLVSFTFCLNVCFFFFWNKKYILIYIQLCRGKGERGLSDSKNFHMVHFRKQDYYFFCLNSVYIRTISWSSVTSVITNWNFEYSMESRGSSWRITKR